MTTFDDFIKELEEEAAAEGPDAVAEFEALDTHFMVGAQILHRRRQVQLSQQALAAASGVPQAEISRIERGVSNPTMTTIGRIVSALGSTPRIMFDWGSTAAKAKTAKTA